jgi:hypothetical protein
MARCVQCGREHERPGPACHECVRDVLEEADRERIPLVGGGKPEARRIGFRPPPAPER